MNIYSINNNSLEAILSNALNSASTSANNTNNSSSTGTNNVTATSIAASDNSQLSLFAQLISMLQELQQSNQSDYKHLTQKIAENLQTAAKTAQANGNTAEANQLSQLSTDFTNAATSGQLPNLQDLFQTLDSGSSSNTKNDSNLNPLEQLLASFQTTGSQAQSSKPLSIILNTISSSLSPSSVSNS